MQKIHTPDALTEVSGPCCSISLGTWREDFSYLTSEPETHWASDTLVATGSQLEYEWVLESITVDWFEARYWLFASSAVYLEMYNTYPATSDLRIKRDGPWSSDY